MYLHIHRCYNRPKSALLKTCFLLVLSLACIYTFVILMHRSYIKHGFRFEIEEKKSPQQVRSIFDSFKVDGVDCAELFRGIGPNDTNKQSRVASYKTLTSGHNIRLDALLNDSRSDPHFCKAFKGKRGYVTKPLSDEEANFGLAYSIMLYKDVTMFERLLRAIYRPQNVYCVHVDKSSDQVVLAFENFQQTKNGLPIVHAAVRAIVGCFNNVFIPPNLVDVHYLEFTSLEADVVCMRELLKYARWKYFINLTGQEFPLRTNRELVRILKIFNGANSIEGSIKHRLNARYTYATSAPPANLTLTKGAVHIVTSRAFVDYAINNETAQRFLNWTIPTALPDETFFTSLQYNPQLGVPGAFVGPPESYENNNLYMARFKNWVYRWGTISLPCAGKCVRGICIFGVGDLRELGRRPEMFANKFEANFEPVAYDCLEERLHNRTREELVTGRVGINETFYAELAFVKSHV